MQLILSILLLYAAPRPLIVQATITSSPQIVDYAPKGAEFDHTYFIEAQDENGKAHLLLVADTFQAKKSDRIAIVFFTSPDGKTNWREIWHDGKEYRCYLQDYLNAKKQGL